MSKHRPKSHKPSHPSRPSHPSKPSHSKPSHSSKAGPGTPRHPHPPKDPRKGTNPCHPTDAVLLLGEGDFSFACALLASGHPPRQLYATVLDSYAGCVEKYGERARDNTRELVRRGVHLLFGVDAVALLGPRTAQGKGKGGMEVGQAEKIARDQVLASDHGELDSTQGTEESMQYTDEREERGVSLKGLTFSRVIWNFPHAGHGIKSVEHATEVNRLLIARFFHNVHLVLSRGKQGEQGEEEEQGEGVWLANDAQGPRARKRGTMKGPQGEESSGSEEEGDGQGNEKEEGEEGEGQEEEEKEWEEDDLPREMVTPDRKGTVLVTLREGLPYDLWDVVGIAKRGFVVPRGQGPKGVQMTEQNRRTFTLHRSFAFVPGFWKGYTHSRTRMPRGAPNEDLLKGVGRCRTWEWSARS